MLSSTPGGGPELVLGYIRPLDETIVKNSQCGHVGKVLA